MKQQFIENLKNGKIPAAQHCQELAELREKGEIFSPLAENIKAELKSSAYWGSNDYFFGKLNLLTHHFSVELCEHLIQVKERLQQIPTQGFRVENEVKSTQSVGNFSQAMPKTHQYIEPDLSGYQPNSKLVGYLNAGDVSAIRAFLSAELSDFRLTIEELIQAVFFVEKNAKNVFEAYKTSAFIAAIEPDESKWDSRYFDKQQGDLNQNFALERFFHLVNVRETLMKKGNPDFQQIKVEKVMKAEPKVQTQARTAPQRSSTIKSPQPNVEPVTNNSGLKALAAILAVGGLVVFALWKLIN